VCIKDLGLDGRIILKILLKNRLWGCGMDSHGCG
jgi:hypothetical protein